MFKLVSLIALTISFQAGGLGPLDGHDLAPTDLDRIQVGQLASDFRLEDETGQVYQLSQYRGQKHVVLVFFRGYW